MQPIAINGRFLQQRITGVQRFGREVLACLVHGDDSYARKSIEVVAPGPTHIDIDVEGAVLRKLGCLNGHLWEQLELVRIPADQTLINLCNTAPMFRRRQIVVLHDVMVAAIPGNFTRTFRAWYKTMIDSYLRNSAAIATVSKFSAQQISHYFGTPLSRIVVLPESGEHMHGIKSEPGTLEKFGLEGDAYFLAVSSAAPNKNFSTVLRAAALLQRSDFKFVIVGGSNSRVFGSGDTAMVESNIVRTGYVSDGELRALYENAACFVYPSFYEGFGLPPLEAMASGCPVIAADASSLPEVCGNAAIYCDPNDPQSLVAALERLLNCRGLREEMRIKGREHAACWRWADAAEMLRSMAGEL